MRLDIEKGERLCEIGLHGIELTIYFGLLEEDWDEGGWGGGITVEDQLVEEVGIFGDVGELFNP